MDKFKKYGTVRTNDGEMELFEMDKLEEVMKLDENGYYLLVKDITEDELEAKIKNYEDNKDDGNYYDIENYIEDTKKVIDLRGKELTLADIKEYEEDGYKFLYNEQDGYVESLKDLFSAWDREEFYIYGNEYSEEDIIERDLELIKIADQWYADNATGAISIYYCSKKSKFIVVNVSYYEDCHDTCNWYTLKELKEYIKNNKKMNYYRDIEDIKNELKKYEIELDDLEEMTPVLEGDMPF